MTKEHKAKLKAGREARKARLAGQIIQIDKTWSVVRLDPMNWRILENGKLPDKRENFYGSLLAAFLDLPEKVVKTAFDNPNDSSKALAILKGLQERIPTVISSLNLPKGV